MTRISLANPSPFIQNSMKLGTRAEKSESRKSGKGRKGGKGDFGFAMSLLAKEVLYLGKPLGSGCCDFFKIS